MARKPSTDRLGASAPKVTQDDLEADVAILTIALYDEDEIPDEEAKDGKRFVAFLTFEELGDKRLYLNKTGLEILIERLGEDADQWPGKQCPVEKVTRKFGRHTFPKVDVVGSEDWDEYLAPKKAPARRGKSRR